MIYTPNDQPASPSAPQSAKYKTRLWLRLTGPFVWGWFASVLAVALVFVGAQVGFWLGAWLAMLIVVFFSMNITCVVREARRARAFTILAYIENAVRLNLPLGLFLRAAALGEKRATRCRLNGIATEIDAGAPLGQTLRTSVPEMPPRITDAVTSAESIGQLKPTLSRIIDRQMNASPGEPEHQTFSRLYPLVLFLSIAWILLGFLIFVFPKFQEIFKDFNVQMPRLSQTVFAAANAFFSIADESTWMIIFAIVIIIILARAMRFTFTPWWPGLFVSKCVDFLSWRVPFWRVLQRHRALADVCQFLADSARAGIPLPAALHEAARLHMNSSMRRRIQRWREATLQGQSPSAAAASAGLPNLIVGFLSTASVPGKLPAPDALAGVFTFLADYYANRFSRLALMLRSIAEPTMTVVMGVVVGAVVISMFLPLVTLINGVMGWKGAGVL